MHVGLASSSGMTMSARTLLCTWDIILPHIMIFRLPCFLDSVLSQKKLTYTLILQPLPLIECFHDIVHVPSTCAEKEPKNIMAAASATG